MYQEYWALYRSWYQLILALKWDRKGTKDPVSWAPSNLSFNCYHTGLALSFTEKQQQQNTFYLPSRPVSSTLPTHDEYLVILLVQPIG